jgi:hypothetical protein
MARLAHDQQQQLDALRKELDTLHAQLAQRPQAQR